MALLGFSLSSNFVLEHSLQRDPSISNPFNEKCQPPRKATHQIAGPNLLRVSGNRRVQLTSLRFDPRTQRQRRTTAVASTASVPVEENEGVWQQQTRQSKFSAVPRSTSGKRGKYPNRVFAVLEVLKGCPDGPLALDWLGAALEKFEGQLTPRDLTVILKEQQQWESALAFFEWMKEQDDYEGDVFFFNVLLKTLGRAGQWREAERLMGEMEREGVEPDNVTYSTLISLLTRCEQHSAAVRWFDRLVASSCIPDEVSYSAAIHALGRAGRDTQAISIFNELKRADWDLDVQALSTVMNLHGKAGRFRDAVAVFNEMKRRGLKQNRVSYNLVIDLYGKEGLADRAEEIFEEMLREGLKPDVVTFCTLVDAHARAGNFEAARKVFLRMEEVAVPATAAPYNAMLSACMLFGQMEEGIKVIEQMKCEEVSMNQKTFSLVVPLMAEAGRKEEGRRLLEEMKTAGYAPDASFFSSLIHAYGRSGSYVDVARTVTEMRQAGVEQDPQTLSILLEMLAEVLGSEQGAEVSNLVLACVNELDEGVHSFLLQYGISGQQTLGQGAVVEGEEQAFDKSGKRANLSLRMMVEDLENLLLDLPEASCEPITNGIVNAFVAAGQREVASKIFRAARLLGLYKGVFGKSPSSWNLHLTGLSLGTSQVAIRDWLLGLVREAKKRFAVPEVMSIEVGKGRLYKFDRRMRRTLRQEVEILLSNLGSPFVASSRRPGSLESSGKEVFRWVRSEQVLSWLKFEDGQIRGRRDSHSKAEELQVDKQSWKLGEKGILEETQEALIDSSPRKENAQVLLPLAQGETNILQAGQDETSSAIVEESVLTNESTCLLEMSDVEGKNSGTVGEASPSTSEEYETWELGGFRVLAGKEGLMKQCRCGLVWSSRKKKCQEKGLGGCGVELPSIKTVKEEGRKI